MWKTYLVVLLTLFLTGQAFGQFPWQKPVQRDPAEVKRIVGPIVGGREPSWDLNFCGNPLKMGDSFAASVSVTGEGNTPHLVPPFLRSHAIPMRLDQSSPEPCIKAM